LEQLNSDDNNVVMMMMMMMMTVLEDTTIAHALLSALAHFIVIELMILL